MPSFNKWYWVSFRKYYFSWNSLSISHYDFEDYDFEDYDLEVFELAAVAAWGTGKCKGGDWLWIGQTCPTMDSKNYQDFR